MHSTVSDGSLPVPELVRAVHAAGVEAFALTDHDSVAGWETTRREAERLGLRTLPGVEVSTRGSDMEHHILGYGFDPEHEGLCAMFDELRERRRHAISQLGASNSMPGSFAAWAYPTILPRTLTPDRDEALSDITIVAAAPTPISRASDMPWPTMPAATAFAPSNRWPIPGGRPTSTWRCWPRV